MSRSLTSRRGLRPPNPPVIVATMSRPRSSRQHYDVFRRDYREGTLDDKIAGISQQPAKTARAKARREY